MTLAFLEGFGSPIHWLVLGFVALLIFGRRLPEVGRSLGKGITEFKKGLKDAGDEVSGHPQDPYQSHNQNQFSPPPPSQSLPPQRPAQQYQQPYPQQQQGYQGQQGYPQQQPMTQPRAQGPQGGPGPGQVRVTRNDMVD